MFKLLTALVFVLLSPVGALAQTSSSNAEISITRMAGGLDQPWGMAFLPDGEFLVTERGGRLLRVAADGTVNSVDGVPQVVARGQGGLLDVMVPRDFASSRQIFLSFVKRQGNGSGTALAVATLSNDGQQLQNTQVIFEMAPGSSGNRHFGSRIVEASDGRIFLTIGDRADRPSAQDLASHNGTIIRINRDGSVPADNPFVGVPGALPEIWSLGHRNAQGAALDLQGNLWINEHGAQGGDEINRVRPGANYGWPVISYGVHYSGAKIGEGTTKEGMEQPAFYWDPSIAPSGLMIYSGKLWPDWRGDFFIGSLKFDYIARLDPDAGFAEEKLQSGETVRVRDVREAPDGSIWFLSAGNGAVYRMVPE